MRANLCESGHPVKGWLGRDAVILKEIRSWPRLVWVKVASNGAHNRQLAPYYEGFAIS